MEEDTLNATDLVSPGNWVDKRDKFFFDGKSMRDSGSLDKAIEFFRKSILIDKKFDPAYEELIECLIDLKQYNEALTDCKNLKTSTLHINKASTYEGIIYFLQKQFDKSTSSFAKALSNDPNNSDGLYYQGMYYLFCEDYEACKTNMKRLCKTDAKNFEAKFCLALSDLFLQNFDDAISIYKQLIKLKPNHLMLNYHLALCYLKKKEYTAASETCEIHKLIALLRK